MILMAALLFKWVLFLAVGAAGYYILRKRISKITLVWMGVVLVVIAAMANVVSSFVPPLRDEVVLTALGEKCEEAQKEEVFLAGYTIDEKDFLCGKSLEIRGGKWFWKGETYCWRIESDTRQPAGTTRRVILAVPVGWDRTLNFEGDKWRGKVEISIGGRTWTVDTYAKEWEIVSESIGRSDTSMLIWNQVRYLAVYTVVLLIGVVCIAFIMQTILRTPDRARSWLKRNYTKLIYLGIALTAFCLMIHYADRDSFWVDEMCQVSFVKGSFAEAMKCCVRLLECSPPLALMCAAIWYHIVPYGEQWLLLPSVFLAALSAYAMGLIGERLKNIWCGMLAALMTAFSTTVCVYAAYEYRAYPYMLAFSALTLYFYIRKNESGRKPGVVVAFAASMTALAMSHYFGMLACACYFLGDLYLWRKNQVKWKEGFLYLPPGVCSIVWFAAVAVYQGRSFISHLQWYGQPSVSGIWSLLRYLTGRMEPFYWILLFSLIGSIVYSLNNIRQNSHQFDWAVFYRGFFTATIIGVILLLFVYGTRINPKSSLWSQRYFMFLIPNTTILSAMFLCDLTDWIDKKISRLVLQRASIVFVGVTLLLNCFVTISTAKSHEPYRETADWLYQKSNYIFNDTTLIITCDYDFVKDGWEEYYITRQGRRDSIHVVSQSTLGQDDILQYDRIYLISLHSNTSNWLQTFLTENYIVAEDNYSNLRLQTYVRK